MKKIITIGRKFRNGGREGRQKFAQALHIAYYDKELLAVAAKKSGLSSQFMNTYDEKPTRSFLYSLVMGQRGLFPDSTETTVEQLAANAQRDAILAVAGEGSCVIVGRCADYILRDEKPFRIFVYADVDSKLDRCMKRKAEDEHLTEQEMKKRMASIDKGRAKYYEFYSDRKWGARENYDLMVNTSGQNIKVVTQAALEK